MKTAKQWSKEASFIGESFIKQIQLEALREGMFRAADIGPVTVGELSRRAAINAAAESLTEKDL